ncbi:hypothetical protein QTP70_017267, partial [Hemibagrus guttatus]
SRSAHVSVGGVAPQCSFRGGRCLTRRQRRRVWQHPAPALPPLGEFQFPARQTSSPRSRRSSVDVARCECSAVDVARSCCSAVDVAWSCGSAVDVIRLCGSAVDVIRLCGSAVDLVRRLRSAVDVASDPLALPSGPLLPPLVSLLLLTPPTCLALILVPPTCLASILVPPTCLALVLASPHSPCFCFSLPPLVPRPASRSPHRPLYVPSSSPGPIAGPDFLGGARGIKAGYTLDSVPTHHRAHTHTHTHSHSLTQSHTTDNLEMPINLPCMSLNWGRKPEYPEETPEARGEHANSTHTAEAGIEPPTLAVLRANH